MLCIRSSGKTRSFQSELLRHLFSALGVQQGDRVTEANVEYSRVEAPFAEIWDVSADRIPAASDAVSWRLGRLQRGDIQSAADLQCFALHSLAADCRYHLLSTMLHPDAQRVQFWGTGYMFAETTLRFAASELAATAFSALLAVLQYAERVELSQPLPTLLQALSNFESQEALRRCGSWHGDGNVVALYDSCASHEEQRHCAELLHENGVVARVGDLESFVAETLKTL